MGACWELHNESGFMRVRFNMYICVQIYHALHPIYIIHNTFTYHFNRGKAVIQIQCLSICSAFRRSHLQSLTSVVQGSQVEEPRDSDSWSGQCRWHSWQGWARGPPGSLQANALVLPPAEVEVRGVLLPQHGAPLEVRVCFTQVLHDSFYRGRERMVVSLPPVSSLVSSHCLIYIWPGSGQRPSIVWKTLLPSQINTPIWNKHQNIYSRMTPLELKQKWLKYLYIGAEVVVVCQTEFKLCVS